MKAAEDNKVGEHWTHDTIELTQLRKHSAEVSYEVFEPVRIAMQATRQRCNEVMFFDDLTWPTRRNPAGLGSSSMMHINGVKQYLISNLYVS